MARQDMELHWEIVKDFHSYFCILCATSAVLDESPHYKSGSLQGKKIKITKQAKDWNCFYL